jgi:hypothetical protein
MAGTTLFRGVTDRVDRDQLVTWLGFYSLSTEVRLQNCVRCTITTTPRLADTYLLDISTKIGAQSRRVILLFISCWDKKDMVSIW